MKRNTDIESRIFPLWDKIYARAKLSSERPGKTAAAKFRNLLKPKELVYLDRLLSCVGPTTYLEKLFQSLRLDQYCEICSNPCLISQHNICQKCYSQDVQKYKKLRRDKAHAESQKQRATSFNSRTEEQKKETLNKFRKTMAKNWEGGHSMRDPTFRAIRLAKYGQIGVVQSPEALLKKVKKFKKNYGIGGIKHRQYLEKREATCMERYGVSHVTKYPEIAIRALKSSHLIKEISIKGKHFKVQGNAELYLLHYLVRRFGKSNVWSQFSKNYPIKKAKLLEWTPDFYVRDYGFVECKSTYTLYDKPDWYESNKKKATSDLVHWYVQLHKSEFLKLPEDWHTLSRNRLILLCKDFTIRRTLIMLSSKVKESKRLSDRVLFKESKTVVAFTYNLIPKDYRILYFYPHELSNHTIAVFNILRSLLNSNKKRIGARKCEVRSVATKQSKDFLDSYHLQGNTSSSIKYGLFYDGKLVALATFRKPLVSSTKQPWELARFCSRPNYTIQGGLSKLLSYFSRIHGGEIISYADKRWATGNAYLKAGFTLIRESEPGYFYLKGNVVISRYQAQKHRLLNLLGTNFNPTLSERQNMLNAGFTIVKDLGQMVFVR